ncbi:MAG: LPS export ABC transporter protein LptC [Saprospiraceae bacterium]
MTIKRRFGLRKNNKLTNQNSSTKVLIKLPYAALTVVFILLFLLSSCQNDLAEIQRFIKQEETTYETISDFKTLYSDSAIVKVKIEGPTMLRYLDKDKPRQEFPDGMKVEFFTPNQRVTSRLTAKYGMRLEKDKQIIMRDSVVWESLNKEILETTELIWDEKEERVFTNKFVVIRRPGEIITGYGFESNQDFTYSKIKSVTGQFASDKLEK